MGTTHYRPDIQGLRAIAVLAVMLFHYNPALLPGGFVGVKALGLDPKIEIDPAYRHTNAILKDLATRHSGVVSMNFESTGIFAKLPFSEGVPIYLDEHHLNEEGAKRYAAVARNAFKNIIN